MFSESLTRRCQGWRWAIAAMAYMVFVWWYSSGTHNVPLHRVPWSDKGAHFLGFGLMSLLWSRALHKLLTKPWVAAFGATALSSLYGAVDEWHQSWVPGRSSDPADWIADTVGAATIASLYLAFSARTAKSPRAHSPLQ